MLYVYNVKWPSVCQTLLTIKKSGLTGLNII